MRPRSARYWPSRTSPILFVCSRCAADAHMHDTRTGQCIVTEDGERCQCRVDEVEEVDLSEGPHTKRETA